MKNFDKAALPGCVNEHALPAAGLWAGTRKIVAFAALFATAPFLSFSQSLDMDQMANGNLSAATLVLNWQNGNLNKSNSHFLTTYSVPYRVKMEGLLPNTQYTYIGGIDVRVQGKNALDLFTHYQRLDPHTQFGHPAEIVNPLYQLSPAFLAAIPNVGTPSTYAIPTPGSKTALGVPQPGTFFDALPAGEKLMTLWGGTIDAVGYDFQGSLTATDAESRIYVTFTTGPGAAGTLKKAVLAYGGNIAADSYWGIGAGAQAINGNGSPYHSRIRGIKTGTWLPYATNAQAYSGGGSADRSLKQDAIYPSAVCSITGPASVCSGTSNAYTAVSSGTYSWSVSGATTGSSLTGQIIIVDAGATNYTVSVTVGNAGQNPSTCTLAVAVAVTPMAPTLSIMQPSCSDAYGHITVTTPDPAAGLYQYSNDNFATWNTTGMFDFAAGAGYSISVRPASNTGCTSGATECPSTGPAARTMAPAPEVSSPAEAATEAILVAVPNPFSMHSTLEFKAPQAGRATLQVFDIKGRLVKEVFNAQIEAGTTYRVSLAGSDFANGTYVARLSLNGRNLTSIRMMSQQK